MTECRPLPAIPTICRFWKEFSDWGYNSSVNNLAGSLSFFCGLVLWATSINWCRRKFFEVRHYQLLVCPTRLPRGLPCDTCCMDPEAEGDLPPMPCVVTISEGLLDLKESGVKGMFSKGLLLACAYASPGQITVVRHHLDMSSKTLIVDHLLVVADLLPLPHHMLHWILPVCLLALLVHVGLFHPW